MRDNFENIKEGDKVLLNKVVSTGFYSGKSFYVEGIVTRTTNTQFLVGERRFKKESGIEIGQSYARNNVKLFKEDEDQTKAYYAFIVDYNKYKKAKKLFKDYRFPEFGDIQKEDLTKIIDLFSSLIEKEAAC